MFPCLIRDVGIYLWNNGITTLTSLGYIKKNLESDFSRVGSIKGGTKENSWLHNLFLHLTLRSINL